MKRTSIGDLRPARNRAGGHLSPLEIVPVSTVDEVLARALIKPLTAIEWPNDLDPVPAKPVEAPEVRAH